jgi:hypothetical protein
MEKEILLTFDYEVFLGSETGTIENSVINPTIKILEILKRNNAKAIFFVDTTWLRFLKEKFPSDFKCVSDQLRNIIEAGSTIELHLHPQWLQASRIKDKIKFTSFEKYRLHSLSKEEILDLFAKSILLLESITSQKISCFRAGGFCIEPFDQIKTAFEHSGIVYDFSVAPGMFLKGGNIYDYNFTNTPNLPFYRFGNDVQTPDNNGNFFEIPLSTYLNNPVYRLSNKLQLKLKKDKIFGDGIGIQEQQNLFSSSVLRRLQLSRSFLTLDKTSHIFFKSLIKYHFRKSKFLVIISHPKTLSGQGLINLSYIVRKYKTLNSYDLRKLVHK